MRIFRKPEPTKAVIQERTPDFSLRPSADTYLDQKGESQKILQRIRTSSALVMGIAGVRGAGKSSIALKVLSACDASGYFTLLIHSPTGYEHREFLLSIFQRVCEATIERVERNIGQITSLQERGLSEAKKINRVFRLILLGVFCTVLIPIAVTYYRYLGNAEAQRQEQAKRETAWTQSIDKDIESLNIRENDLAKEQHDLERKLVGYGVPIEKLSSKDQPRSREDRPESLESLLIDRNDYSRSKPPVISSDLKKTYDEYNLVRQNLLSQDDERRRLQDQKLRPNLIDPLEHTGSSGLQFQAYAQLGINVVLGVFLYAVATFTLIGARRVRRKYNIHKKHANEVGLAYLAKETLEHLKYQATLTNSEDASVSLWKLSGKFLRSKSLATLPVSLPGLTADCTSFLDKVADVFGQKCVICLDELDKINDPDQLAELLKGVKGILGQRRTYFLLTVSEDALARFSARRRAERDIIESAFDEILYLDRVGYDLSQIIVDQMLALNDGARSTQFIANSILVWIFAGGIPREIKRNVILCAANNLDLTEADHFTVWRVLFEDLLNALESWALVLSKEKDISYRFLRCLDETRRKLPHEAMPREGVISWYKGIIADWSEYYRLPFLQMDKKAPDATVAGGSKDAEAGFERCVIELALGAVSLLVLAGDIKSRQTVNHLKGMREVFSLLSYSLSYGGYKFHQLLLSMDCD